MKSLLENMKYDIEQILNNLSSIENTEKKMIEFVGKPFYKGCEENINKCKKVIDSHKESLTFNVSEYKYIQTWLDEQCLIITNDTNTH